MSGARFGDTNENLALWLDNEQTDIFVGEGSAQRTTKQFERKGGFKGTSVNATYIVKRLTAAFGPRGIGWDCEPMHEEYREGGSILHADTKAVIGHEIVHIGKYQFWYMLGDKRGKFVQYGQTMFITGTKYGTFTDEEAPKKSLTDAMVKSASHLGFAADIHMGMWDDTKWTKSRVDEAVAERRAEMLARPYAFVNADGDIFHSRDAATWKAEWINRIGAWITAKKPGLINETWRGNEEAIEAMRMLDGDLVAEIESIAVEAVKTGRMPEQRKPPNGAATHAPANDPGPPPDSYTLIDAAGATHVLTKAENRTPQERWLTGWTLQIDRAKEPAKITEVYRNNVAELRRIALHWPQIAAEADKLLADRCAKLRMAHPGDAPTQNGQGAAGK